MRDQAARIRKRDKVLVTFSRIGNDGRQHNARRKQNDPCAYPWQKREINVRVQQVQYIGGAVKQARQSAKRGRQPAVVGDECRQRDGENRQAGRRVGGRRAVVETRRREQSNDNGEIAAKGSASGRQWRQVRRRAGQAAGGAVVMR